MAILHYTGGDTLSPSSWQKDGRPLCQTAEGGRGPFGPGHGSFINLNGEVMAVYHATDGAADGWANRKARCQRVVFGPQGPWMGGVVGVHVNDFEAFTKGFAPAQGSQSQQPMGQSADGHAKHKGGLRGFLHTAGERLREL